MVSSKSEIPELVQFLAPEYCVETTLSFKDDGELLQAIVGTK